MQNQLNDRLTGAKLRGLVVNIFFTYLTSVLFNSWSVFMESEIVVLLYLCFCFKD